MRTRKGSITELESALKRANSAELEQVRLDSQEGGWDNISEDQMDAKIRVRVLQGWLQWENQGKASDAWLSFAADIACTWYQKPLPVVN